jgi:hypothetical protein
MIKYGKKDECVITYQNVYEVGNSPGSILIKIKVIQELIQIIRPKCWSHETLDKLVENLIITDKYIARKNHTNEKYQSKWKFLEDWKKSRNWKT